MAAFVILALAANLLAAVLSMIGLLYYVFVYTGYLKRSTPHNIVIGGVAGAIPPLVGYAAVTGTVDVLALFLFLVIFYWTPPHTWALGLLIRTDYERVNIPMLPVVAGETETRQQILLVHPADDRRDAAAVCVPDDGLDLLCGGAAAERDVPGARAQAVALARKRTRRWRSACTSSRSRIWRCCSWR